MLFFPELCPVLDIEKLLTFCNIFLITEDTGNYLKLGVCVHYPNSNLLLRETIQHAFFFPELCHFFYFDFSSYINAPQSSVGTCMRFFCSICNKQFLYCLVNIDLYTHERVKSSSSDFLQGLRIEI